MSWKPSVRDLELIVEHSVGKATIDTTAKALGVSSVELMLFLLRLEKGREYTPPADADEPAATPYWMRAATGAFK